MEALRLYEPLEHIDAFHSCRAPDRVLRGSNRSGKTISAAVEIARALTGQDPYGKYPTTNGRCFIVGKDGKHNSEVLFRKLCRPGAFDIIQDEKTGKWRAWKPWLEADAARSSEIKKAPPLVPPRLIKDVSWESLKELNPNTITLTNGWEVRFFSSLGSPPQGSDIDLAWFDEEIVNIEWYPEISARLIDRSGKFMWSATAQLGGPQLYDLCLQSDECRGEKNPRIVEFFAHIDHNKYFTQSQRELFFEKLTEEQRRIRIEGEFAFTSAMVYPEFSISKHVIKPFSIPANWTRYMVVDPGRQRCAVLFAVIPPSYEDNANHVYFYDELYLKNCNAETFGQNVREKTMDQVFYSFLIDYRGSRIRLIDSGLTVEQQYAEALKKYNVTSASTGSGFTWTNDDVEAGFLKFRSWLNPTKDKPPSLKVFADRLPHFEYEIQRYHYKRDRNGLTDKPDQRNNHLMDCCRYLAMYDPKFHKVQPKRAAYDPVQIVKNKLKRQKMKTGPVTISLS